MAGIWNRAAGIFCKVNVIRIALCLIAITSSTSIYSKAYAAACSIDTSTLQEGRGCSGTVVGTANHYLSTEDGSTIQYYDFVNAVSFDAKAYCDSVGSSCCELSARATTTRLNQTIMFTVTATDGTASLTKPSTGTKSVPTSGSNSHQAYFTTICSGGACGSAGGNTYSSAPQAATALCASGTPSAVTGTGPWNWTCTASGGTANCSAQTCMPAVNGVCNNSAKDACTSGTAANSSETATTFTWTCNGANGGSNSSTCSTNKPSGCTVGNEVEINDWDGWAGEGFNPSAPEGGPCVASQYMAPANRFGGGNWFACNDSGNNPASAKGSSGPHAGTVQSGKCISRVWRNGGSNSNATQCKVFGYECGGSSGGSTNGSCNTATLNCNAGTYVDMTDTTNEYKWRCNGLSGGTDDLCTTNKPVVNGQCNNSSQNGCTSGTWQDVTDDTNNYYWACKGSNGGSNADNCAMAKPAPSYTYAWESGNFGACSATCGGGNQTRSVVCKRNDGATAGDSNCTSTKPTTSQPCNTQACVVAVNGTCNNSAQNSCTTGTADDAAVADTSTEFRWACNGSNGGTNATNCSSAKPAASCTLGPEVEINDVDGFGPYNNTSGTNPCRAANYIGAGSGSFESGFASCGDSQNTLSTAKGSSGPHTGTTITGTTVGCISRVWVRGGNLATTDRCVVMGYRCGN